VIAVEMGIDHQIHIQRSDAKLLKAGQQSPARKPYRSKLPV
jgi:hypothetical protein